MSVIARSTSDEAISAENKNCFAPLAMTFSLNFTALPLAERDRVRGKVVARVHSPKRKVL
jgi:hypothetical protein